MRIIASILLQESNVVQTYRFQDCSIIGSPTKTTRHLEQWGIDEFLLIQKDGSFNHLKENLTSIISETSTPITVCGGLNSFSKCSELIKAGADRICLQSLVFDDFDSLKKLSDTYGGQSITLKFDIIPSKKRLRTSGRVSYSDFIDWFNAIIDKLAIHDIKDILFYDVEADGNQAKPDFSIIEGLDLSALSLILGGGLNQSNCEKIYSQFNSISNDISLSFSNCLYQKEVESIRIINTLGTHFSKHRLYQKQ